MPRRTINQPDRDHPPHSPTTSQQLQRERASMLHQRLALLLAEMNGCDEEDDLAEDDYQPAAHDDSLLGHESAPPATTTSLIEIGVLDGNSNENDTCTDEDEEVTFDDDMFSCSSVARSIVEDLSAMVAGGDERVGDDDPCDEPRNPNAQQATATSRSEENEDGRTDDGGRQVGDAIRLIQRFVLRHVLRRTTEPPIPIDRDQSADDNDSRDEVPLLPPPEKGTPHDDSNPTSPVSHVGDDGLPEPVLNALRILQNRFRFARLRRQVNERDREEAIRRLQELWRRRREVNLHFQAMRRGKEHAAARDIQTAFRAALSRRQRVPNSPSSPSLSTAASSAAHTAHIQHRYYNSPSRSNEVEPVSGLPLCIICMSNIVGIALLPCGHAHVCGDCGQHLRRCPSCRRRIALQIRIFL